ncbi:MAG: nucleotidyltransferase family protein [Candidatus Poribacteria bacterium]|nr:nucleotidyltransferase family protein [Candidatus Poribacteria bacterium]
MRVLIPVAGRGSRLRPYTNTVPKALLEYEGQTILSHILEPLKQLDISEYVFVIGYLGEQVQSYVEMNYPTLPAAFVEQTKLKGVGHAIYETRQFLGCSDGSPLLIVLGDVIIDTDWQNFVACRQSVVGIQTVEQKKSYGVAHGVGDRISFFEEKPTQVDSKLAGCYLIHEVDLLFNCLAKIIESENLIDGEYQLTDALDLMLYRGAHIFMREVEMVDWEKEYQC